MGLLLWFGPVLAAGAVAFLLWPVSPALATVGATAAWLLVALKFWGGGGSTGDDRYDDVGGPFDV
jgi:hypothetical protein